MVPSLAVCPAANTLSRPQKIVQLTRPRCSLPRRSAPADDARRVALLIPLVEQTNYSTGPYQCIAISAVTIARPMWTDMQYQTPFQLQTYARDHPKLAYNCAGKTFRTLSDVYITKNLPGKNFLQRQRGDHRTMPPKYATDSSISFLNLAHTLQFLTDGIRVWNFTSRRHVPH